MPSRQFWGGGVLVDFTHGFRMPLFFVLSGFFTAMLVRKRGLGGLLRNRVSRILAPLGYGCLTIVLLVWGFIIYAASGGATFGVPESHENLWSAAALGDQTQINRFIENGWPLDDPDPFFEQSPLA